MLFETGAIVATPGAAAALRSAASVETHPLMLLARHTHGDWGDLDAHDREVNRQALKHGGRLLSSYPLPNGVRIWLITEADRSATTFLLPEEY